MTNDNKIKLGKILLKRKLVDATELDTLLTEQEEDHEPLASKALGKGLIDETKALKALSEQHGVPAINLEEVTVDLANLKMIPQDIAQKHLILPIEVTADTIHLAMANPNDRRVIDELEFVSGKRIFPHVALHNHITATIKQCYEAQSSGESVFYGARAIAKQESVPPANIVLTTSEVSGANTVIADYDVSEDEDFTVEIDIPEDDLSMVVDAPPATPSPQHAVVPQPPKQPIRPAPVLKDKPAGQPLPPDRQPDAAVPQKRVGTSKKILVVDDEDDIRLLISRLLSDKGYHVVTAARGLEAIKKVQAENPDMIVLDAMLPEVHGFDICKKIKDSAKYGHIPVLMISAIYRGWRYAQDLKNSYGVDDFIEKPFKVNELVEKVETLVQASDKTTATRSEELSKEAERTLAAGLAAYRDGRIDAAVDLLKKGIHIDPLAFKLHYHLALLLGKKGLNYQAIRTLENALELAPDYFPALKNLAVLYQKAGFKFKAIETWERALGYCPDENTRDGIKRHLVSLL
ncbi:MAG: response regulator [Myxococcota bacterium]|nr:response regulator [Myxococcota bacterium]